MATKKFKHTSSRNGRTVYKEYTYRSNDSDADGWDEGDFRRNGYEPDIQEYSEEEWAAKSKAEFKTNLGCLAIFGIIIGAPIIFGLLGMLCKSIFNIASGISSVVYYAIAGGIVVSLVIVAIFNRAFRRKLFKFLLLALIFGTISVILLGMWLYFT